MLLLLLLLLLFVDEFVLLVKGWGRGFEKGVDGLRMARLETRAVAKSLRDDGESERMR